MNTMVRCDLTDLLRVECSCPEHAAWVFDYDDLTDGERAYFDGKTSGQQISMRLRKVIAKPLPDEYVSRPWTEARNVPMPSSGETCKACGQRPAGDQFVCNECLDDLRVALGDVPSLLQDLGVMQTRQARQTRQQQPRTRPEHTRWDDVVADDPGSKMPAGRQLANAGFNRLPYDATAGNVARTLGSEVLTGVRILAEARGCRLPADMDADEGSRWLMTNLSTVAQDPAGPDIVIGVKRAHDRAMRVIDNQPEGVYIGVCECRQPMFARPDKPEHECTTCHKVYVVEDQLAAQKAKIGDSLLTVGQLAKVCGTEYAKVKISRHRINRLVARNRLIRRASNRDGDALYLADDLFKLLEGEAS